MIKENINWIIRDQERKQLIELPKWASVERYEYVDGFLEWWHHRKK